jgi:hypothetical protein
MKWHSRASDRRCQGLGVSLPRDERASPSMLRSLTLRAERGFLGQEPMKPLGLESQAAQARAAWATRDVAQTAWTPRGSGVVFHVGGEDVMSS